MRAPNGAVTVACRTCPGLPTPAGSSWRKGTPPSGSGYRRANSAFDFRWTIPHPRPYLKAMPALPRKDEMESAFQRRDSAYDGIFWLGVRTTGIFCRPSCPARKPLGRNVEYFATVREAIFAGFRPCKRCRPLEAGDALPPWAQTLIDRLEAEPETRINAGTLRRMGIEPARARRFFLGRYGMTFHAFA